MHVCCTDEMDGLRNDILEKLSEKFPQSGLRLPRDYRFSGDRDNLTMTFAGPDGYTASNMQENDAAFEGWAVALYVHYMDRQGRITLDLPSGAPPFEPDYRAWPHRTRFLYRALKFSRQYSWFRPSERLAEELRRFEQYMAHKKLVNNFPLGEAHKKTTPEGLTESRFCGEDAGLLWELLAGAGLPKGDIPIFSQLPTGLFEDEVAHETGIFPRSASAIDLWTVSGDTLAVIELKTENKMIGVLTEVFFYANYARDLFVRSGGLFAMSQGGTHRGYPALCTAAPSLKHVRGILLLDEGSVHPLLKDTAVLDVLNAGSDRETITYSQLIYPKA